MKKMAKKNKKSKRLFLLLLWLLLTVIMFGTSSFAWFTSNRVVTVNTLNVHVATAGGIEISTDGQNWKAIVLLDDITTVHDTTYPSSVNQIPYEIEPVSSGKEVDGNGRLKLFYGVTDSNETGDYILTATRSYEEEGNGPSSNGKFIAFDIFLKVNSDSDLYLTNNSGVTYTGEDKTGIAAATRIAFVKEGTVDIGADLETVQGLNNGNSSTTYLWEPNYDVHTASGVSNAFNTYGITTTQTGGSRLAYDGVISEIAIANNILLRNSKSTSYPSYFKRVNVDYYTPEVFTEYVPVFSLERGITKVRIYMWIEGQDVDCENNASYADIDFNVQLTVNPS